MTKEKLNWEQRAEQRAREFRARIARGEDPGSAAETIDASFMSFEEWRAAHRPRRRRFNREPW